MIFYIMNKHIDMEELFEKQKQRDKNRLDTYEILLERIHTRIKLTARQRNEKWLFFQVPEFIFGRPKYDTEVCIGFLIEKLTDNGFMVKYISPNVLIISWKHYVSKYERDEIFRRTGVRLDKFGKEIENIREKVQLKDYELPKEPKEPKSILKKKEVKYKDVNDYKNIGIYDMELIKKLE
jgi:hypothetical protein